MTAEWSFAERIDRDGFAVVDRLLGDEEVQEATDLLEERFASEDDVAEERGWLTGSYRVAYALPVGHLRYAAICTAPAVVDLVRSVLGDDVVVAGCNGFDLLPGGTGQDLHRDHPHPSGTTSYLHVVCALDEFTVQNGATRVVPGSHRGDPAGAPSQDPPSGLGDDAARVVEVPRGGAVAFDGALLHAAGTNRGERPRRALHLFYCRAWARPHWDFPASFTPHQASRLDEEQKRLFGFGSGARRYDQASRRVIR